MYIKTTAAFTGGYKSITENMSSKHSTNSEWQTKKKKAVKCKCM